MAERKEKATAAETVKKLTKVNVDSAGKPEVSIEDLQSQNEKSIKFLRYGIGFLSFYFICMVVAVLLVTLKTKEIKNKMNDVMKKDNIIVSEIAEKTILINNAIPRLTDFNSGKGIDDAILDRVSKLPMYKRFQAALAEVQPLQKEALDLLNDIRASGVDTLWSGYNNIIDGGASKHIPSSLQAVYPEEQAVFFDHGCHSTDCKFSTTNAFIGDDGMGGTKVETGTIETCLKKCTRPSSLTAGVEYGFTYGTDGKSCYCKTTGAHTFSPNNDTVYYRFNMPFFDGGASKHIPSLLQAVYPEEQAVFFDHGCHSTDCTFSTTNAFIGDDGLTVETGTIETCLQKCTRPSSLTAGVEYGFTYGYKDGKSCYCKTTGAHTFSPSNDNYDYVYYRFIWT